MRDDGKYFVRGIEHEHRGPWYSGNLLHCDDRDAGSMFLMGMGSVWSWNVGGYNTVARDYI